MTKPATAPRKKKAAAKTALPPHAIGKDGKRARGKLVTETALKPNQLQVLFALVQGKTREEAADIAGVTIEGVRYMLGIPVFKAAYDQAMLQLQQRARIDADGLIEALIPAATVDIRDFYRDDGVFKPIAEWTESMGKAVAGIEFDDIWSGTGEDRAVVGVTTKVKFWPKTEAVDKLAKLLGAYAAKKHVVQVGVVVVPAKTPAPETLDTTFKRMKPDAR